ncbi:MAG: 2-(1,2-epoxy,2-dihydrophenyl)acetyl-CoA isomerase [Hydrocarboniphaga sp.]|uniref:enoyl-CoA hydratase/isomerase family protein n=1 Tax=Hydrocarboniphaga sp. TaxID=2033016 RepID=UPI00261FBC0B|nr:enoyl-CoA hydratase-related protein [Hydrocarboniphaga sp.]MDB5971904.1 2-(1,2-epoxy,2-dihydrophenyl)acetyl-CoA isomerase [Hydrocarboniphaga sp.]
MTYESITLDVSDGLARIALNQADIGNPFNAAFCSDWGNVANELSSRKEVRAVLITAHGKFFSVGGDIQMFSKNIDVLPDKIRDWTAGLHMGAARMARLNAPIVAAVHATCMGGACALVAHSDLVFSARSVKFGAAYSQIGYSCDAGASTGLASRMGISRARRFLILSEVLNAEDAATAGLVDYVVDDAMLFVEAEKAAIKLAQGPTRAYGEIRRLMSRSLAQPFEAQLEDEAQALSRVAAGNDAREGITAFVEKRKPRFTGQ